MSENSTSVATDYAAAVARARAAEHLNEWAGVFIDALVSAVSVPDFHANILFIRPNDRERSQMTMTGHVHQRKIILRYDHVIIRKNNQLGGRIRFNLAEGNEEKALVSVLFDAQGDACFEGETIIHHMKLSSEVSLVRRPTSESGSLEELQKQILKRLTAIIQKGLDVVDL